MSRKPDLLLEYSLWAITPGKPLVAKLTWVGLCALMTSLALAFIPTISGNPIGRLCVCFLVASAWASMADFGLWLLLYRKKGEQ